MAKSIMSMKEVRNHVHRSGYDMSFRNCFTAKVGEILPVSCDAVLPGDRWSIDLRQFMRTAPVQAATFGRLRQYYDFYFVPLRLLWDKFPAWIVQTKNSYHARDLANPASNFTSSPYLSGEQLLTFMTKWKTVGESGLIDGRVSRYYAMRKLLSYLGYGTETDFFQLHDNSVGDFHWNPFPILGYQKIYQDWFRFAQWEEAAPWTYNLDYILQDSQLQLDLSSLENIEATDKCLFDLNFCNYDKDLYNGILPAPQFGDTAIAGPIGGMPSASNPSDLLFTLPINQDASGAFGANLIYNAGQQNQIQGVSTASSAPVTAKLADAYFPGSASLGLSVLLLRQAEMRQKWAEITMSGSPDYKEQLAKHWNVNVSDAESYRCKYLGGVSQDIDISEVINTNLEGEDSQASIAGKGISAGQGHIEFTSNEYGLLYCVYHCKPLIDWKQGYIVNKYNTVVDAMSYPVPEFDNVGMESVQAFQFLNPNVQGGLQAGMAEVGYAPRYIDWKTKVDVCNGAFEHSLSPWVIPHWNQQGAAVTPSVNYMNFKVFVDSADGIFAVNAASNDANYETDQLYCTAYFKAGLVRNLSRNGLPF